MSTSVCPFTGATVPTDSTEAASEHYECLYHAFVAPDADSDTTPEIANITVTLHNASAAADTGDFIVIGSTEMLIKQAGVDQPISLPFRKGGVPGFTQLTSVSHITPGMAYLAKSIANNAAALAAATASGDQAAIDAANASITATNTLIDDYLGSLTALRDDNDKFTWLSTSTNPTYTDRADKLESIISFAIYDGIAFLQDDSHKTDGNYSFTMEQVIAWFGLQNVFTETAADRHPSLWKGVMVSTFGMIVLDTIYNLTEVKDNSDILSTIDWPNVEILVAGQIGATSAGLEQATHSTIKLIHGLANYYTNHIDDTAADRTENVISTEPNVIPDANIIFAPFSAISDWPEAPAEDDPDCANKWTKYEEKLVTDYTNFKVAYNNLKDRIEASTAMFANMTVSNDDSTSIPDAVAAVQAGKYANRLESKIPIYPAEGRTEQYDLDWLTRRMAFTMIDYTDTLSDCVTEWTLTEWRTSSPNPYKVEDTGLTGMNNIVYPDLSGS